MRKVTILYKFLPQYRVEFFNKLRHSLVEEDIELELIYGKLKNKDSLKGDEVSIDWAEFVANKRFSILGFELLWQPVLSKIKDSDLVIVEQANKLLVNYVLQFRRIYSKVGFAFWGHGLNMQIEKSSWKNRFKKLIINRSDWWFAYTNNVKELLIDGGYSADNITVVENAIDTASLRNYSKDISEQEIEEARLSLGIDSTNVGIYCGGLYREKRIPFLFGALKQIKEVVPDFHFIILGDGPDADLVHKYANDFNSDKKWVHYVGSKFNKDKVVYFKLSKVFLMPGLVGLAILDSFALQTPMITTDYEYHSPEIEYLEHELNGLISENSIDEYSKVVIGYLNSVALQEKLAKGCLQSAEYYTVERMVGNFRKGIVKCFTNF